MKAYSYTRFSTPEQAEGDSLRRQKAMVEAWLKANPEYELDTSLNFHDAGVSAFRGRNAKTGKLAAFLKLIEDDKVKTGSVLLVEEWSRFSRQNPYDGAPVCRQIFDAGVGIVDLRNNIRYDAQTMRDQVIRLRLDLEWERAHRESEEKSIRMQSAWAAKREKAAASGAPLTSMCPKWLLLRNGKYEVIGDRADTIRLIYEMKAAGIGSGTIARKLNAMPDVWKPEPHAKNKRGGWWPSYIEKIIRNRAAVGEFTSPKLSEPIPDYFPAVVDRDLYNRVAARLARNAAIPGHGSSNVNGAINNLFGHVCRCALCGGTMAFVNKGPSPKGNQYLQCEKARRGLGCNKHAVRYDRLEPTLLHLTRDLEPAVLLVDRTELAREQKARHQRRQKIQDGLLQIAREVDSLAESISRSDGARKRVLEAKLDQKLALKDDLDEELKDAAPTRPNRIERVVDRAVSVESLIKHMKQLEGPERNALRRRLRSDLHGILDKIEVEPGQHESKIVMRYRNGFTLHLVADRQGTPTLYHFDGHGGVDVDPDASETVAAERAKRQRRLNRLVAKSLRKHGLSAHMPL